MDGRRNKTCCEDGRREVQVRAPHGSSVGRGPEEEQGQPDAGSRRGGSRFETKNYQSNDALTRKIRGSSTAVGAGHVALNSVP